MIWVILFITVCLLIHYIVTKPYKYFKERGIDYEMYRNPYIDSINFVLARVNAFNDFRDMYRANPDKPFYGSFMFKTPEICIRDPDLIRQITTKDFDHFTNHIQVFYDPETDPLIANMLIALKNKRWHSMRQTLTPTYTGKQMRWIFSNINNCGIQFADYLKTQVQTQEDDKLYEVDFGDAAQRFANDMIATTAFGIKVNSFAEPNNQFYKLSSKLISLSPWRFFMKVFSPRLAKFLGVTIIEDSLLQYFINILDDVIQKRKTDGIIRPDFLQVLLQAKADLENHNAPKEGSSTTNKDDFVLTDRDIYSQSFIFFFAGLEVVSVLISWIIYELSLSPEIQDRVHKEIDETYKNCPDGLTYDAITDMKYLDMVCREALRKWPPTGGMDRCCNKRYELKSKDGQTLILEPGMGIQLPILGFHRDPKYFPNPEKFDPERFSDERKHEIHPYAYIPFGAGPRKCIAGRFALLEAKIFIYHLMLNFSLHVVERSPIPVKIKNGVGPMRADTYWFGLKPRKLVD